MSCTDESSCTTEDETSCNLSDDDEAAPLLATAPDGPTVPDGGSASQLECSRTLFILYLGVAVNAADVTLLPSMFKALEEDLGLNPELLGTADFLTSLCAAVFALAWGSAADSLSRVKLLSCASLLWGAFSMAIGCSTDKTSFLFFKSLNGAALGALYPIKWSLLCDLAPKGSRGFVFGLVGVAGACGQVAGSLFATTISESHAFRIAGWRLAFFALSFLCFAYSALLWLAATEPVRTIGHAQTPLTLRKVCKQVLSNLKFVLLICSEMIGSVPSHAMHWLTLWLQYSGYSNFQCGLLASVYRVGLIGGSLAGGVAADRCALLYRSSSEHVGRIVSAQVAQACGIGLCCLMFGVDSLHLVPLAVLLFLTGASVEWVDLGTNKPLLMESVPASIRGCASGIEHLCVHTFGALLGGPLVGYLVADVFGYQTSALPVSEMRSVARHDNEQSIRHAMLWVSTIPYVGCIIVLAIMRGVYQTNDKDITIRAKFRSASVMPVS